MAHSEDETGGLAEISPVSNFLRPLNRYITTHDSSSGHATFSSAVPEAAPVQVVPKGARFSLLYTTSSHPVDMGGDKDIKEYEKYMENPPGIVVGGGSVCRVVDMVPGATSPMHRTVSLDYGCVIEGEVECVLDSGEVKLLKRGDVCVQRGTNHAWRNVTPGPDGKKGGGWSRMLFVLQEGLPIEVGGKVLGEKRDDLEGERASS